MKIIKRYFIVQFLKPFLFGLGSFIIIMTVSQLFEYLDTFTGMKARPLDIFQFLSFQIPHWTVQVLPVAILLGILFSLNKLGQNGELIAIKASGIPLKKVLYPLLVLGTVLSVLIILLNETIIPTFNKHANNIYQVNIRRLPKHDITRWEKIVLSGKGNIRITAEQLNLQRGYLKRVVVDEFQEINLVKQIDAVEAYWTGTIWEFTDGAERYFSADQKSITREIVFKKKKIDIYNTPNDLAPQRIKPAEMNCRELLRYIAHLKKIGIPNTSEKVQLHLKIAFPFANLIVILIGIPFALYSQKGSGKLMSFGFALIVAFAYWGVISVGQSLGNGRILPPIIAAWFANIIFGILGIIAFRKIKT
ncbi:MAG: LptF/LptG family permease [bacterium]